MIMSELMLVSRMFQLNLSIAVREDFSYADRMSVLASMFFETRS